MLPYAATTKFFWLRSGQQKIFADTEQFPDSRGQGAGCREQGGESTNYSSPASPALNNAPQSESQRVLALLERTTASSLNEFIYKELKLSGTQADLVRVGIEKLLKDSPLRYKFDD